MSKIARMKNGFLIFQLLLESFGNKSSYLGNWVSTKIGSGVWFCWDLEDSSKFLGELAKIVGILVGLTKGIGVFIGILCGFPWDICGLNETLVRLIDSDWFGFFCN